MLASLIIFPQWASCALMKSPSSSGVEENPSKPIFLNCAWVSGLSMILRKAPLSLVTICGGVRIAAVRKGATRRHHSHPAIFGQRGDPLGAAFHHIERNEIAAARLGPAARAGRHG